MKTKAFLVVCLIMGIGLTQLSAQNGKGGTGNYNEIETIEGNDFPIEIFCDGELVDVLNFPTSFDLKVLIHFKNGVETWGKFKLNNAQYTSVMTEEVFKAQDIEKSYQKGYFVWHMNLNGNDGNHYIVKMVFDTETGDLLEYHSVCH